jgi:hypothetical protein
MKVLTVLFIIAPFFVTSLIANPVGLLPEKIAWSYGNEYVLAQLSKDKPEYLSISNSDNLRYGEINMGTDPVDFVLIQGENPLLWVDSNNNGNLMDDEIIAPSTKESLNNEFIFGWEISVKSFYETQGSGESRLIRIMASKEVTEENFEIRYCLYEHREGLVLLENEELRKVKLFTKNNQGFYRLEDTYFGIDTDGDGQICIIPDSYETFSYDSAFQIGKKTYKLKEVSEDGRKVFFTETEEDPVEKPKFIKGKDFPFPNNFDSLVKEINKKDLLGNVFIVLLSKATPEQIKGNRLDENSGFDSLTAFNRFRLDEIINLSEKCTNLKIFWIVTSGNNDSYKEYPNIYLTDSSSLVRYYGMPGEERVYIVDEEGTLVQFDDYWVDEETLETKNPQSGKLMLGAKDIRKIILDLIFN